MTETSTRRNGGMPHWAPMDEEMLRRARRALEIYRGTRAELQEKVDSMEEAGALSASGNMTSALWETGLNFQIATLAFILGEEGELVLPDLTALEWGDAD